MNYVAGPGTVSYGKRPILVNAPFRTFPVRKMFHFSLSITSHGKRLVPANVLSRQ